MKTKDSTIITLPGAGRMAWLKDLAAYKKLRDTEKQFADARAEVLDGLKRLEGLEDVSAQAEQGLRPLSATIRLRMALRVAVAKVRHRKAPAPKTVLTDELAYLNASLTEKAGQMRALEARILTAEPGTLDEARLLLDFISDLVACGRRIDSKQLAPLLKRCAVVMTAPDAGPRPANTEQRRQQS